MSKSDERAQSLRADSPAFRPSSGSAAGGLSASMGELGTDGGGSGPSTGSPLNSAARNGSPGWSPKARFNPKSRFNPNRSFTVADRRGGSGASSPGPGSSAGQAAALRPTSSEGVEAKKFNPTSVFSPKRPPSGAAPSGPAASSSPLVPNSGLIPPTGPAGVPTGPAASIAGSNAAPEVGVFSDLTPKFSPMLSEYNQLYHAPLHPLQYHLYAPTPFRVRPALEAHQRAAQDLFISSDLREMLQRRNDAILQVLPTTTLPEFVHVYHSLMPLDTKLDSKGRFGQKMWRYKAISNTDGRTYCLLRVENYELPREQALSFIAKWVRVASSALVGVVEAFTTVAFGDSSLVIVYEYYPLAEPIETAYSSGTLPEGLLWSFVTQVAGGLHAIHRHNLAAGVLDCRSILVTQKNRLRIGSCGLRDVLEYDTLPPTIERQRQDWYQLGEMLLKLTAGSSSTKDSIDARHSAMSKYSPSMMAFVDLLLDYEPTPADSVVNEHGERDTLEAQVMRALAPHLLRVVDTAFAAVDDLEATLSHELENARLVRLLCKLEFVMGWAEQANDPAWAPSGEQYPLKLFMDYVFHQVTDQERPSLDLAHALAALNKLDAGIDENILLVSHDETVRMVISYKELRTMFDQAFRALRKE